MEEIFEKGLLFLLPFYIFVHENRFGQYIQDSKELEMLREEYAYIKVGKSVQARED